MEKVKVSVMFMSYNHGAYIRQAMDSVLRQKPVRHILKILKQRTQRLIHIPDGILHKRSARILIGMNASSVIYQNLFQNMQRIMIDHSGPHIKIRQLSET